MRLNWVSTASLLPAMLAAAAPAQAEDLGGGVSVNGGATVVSDYRFRGISQTDKRFAVQGTMSVSHESGLYAAVWGSSIDDYVAAGADAEIDLSAGYKKTFGGTTVDAGFLYYYYPGSGDANTDFGELYASVTQAIGPVSAKALVAYAPKQSALTVGAGDEDNLYLAGDLSGTLPGAPQTLTAHVGHSFGPSYLTIGDEYTDWSLGASYAVKNLTFGISYVDTDGTFITPSGRNASKAGWVGSVGVAF
jgi:uncharacterized protein (TIGR02001 family)